MKKFTVCDYCGTLFYKKPSRIKSSNRHYCSQRCNTYHKSSLTHTVTSCGYCRRILYRKTREIKESKSGLVFCNSSCASSYNGALFTGSNARNWNGGSASYRSRALRHYGSKCCICGYDNIKGVLVVHHIDRNRGNGDITNLAVLCPTCHNEEHYLSKDGMFTPK